MIFMLFIVSGSTFSNTCNVPDLSKLDNNYDWKISQESNECYKKIINSQPDYYMLSISYSPGFCSTLKNIDAHHKFQCDSNNNFTWVVHGLWAQSTNPPTCEYLDKKIGKIKTIPLHPRYCKGDDIGLIPIDIISRYLCTQPGELLLQSEWKKHGTCGDFLDAEDYFKKTQELFNKLVFPETYIKEPDIFNWMVEHNHELKKEYLKFESHELRICYSRAFEYISCP